MFHSERRPSRWHMSIRRGPGGRSAAPCSPSQSRMTLGSSGQTFPPCRLGGGDPTQKEEGGGRGGGWYWSVFAVLLFVPQTLCVGQTCLAAGSHEPWWTDAVPVPVVADPSVETLGTVLQTALPPLLTGTVCRTRYESVGRVSVSCSHRVLYVLVILDGIKWLMTWWMMTHIWFIYLEWPILQHHSIQILIKSILCLKQHNTHCALPTKRISRIYSYIMGRDDSAFSIYADCLWLLTQSSIWLSA